ncbi:EAL domain-containing protein [Pandoraea sp. NPDC087047]|uniref:EAL domain-containing protein n=1 Tax=Pandoraea sp. NPDC087047 TaxID=3364390 RepID=UPI00382FE294
MIVWLGCAFLGASYTVEHAEHAVAIDLTLTVNSILDTVIASSSIFAPMLEKPCASVQRALTSQTSLVPYVREVALLPTHGEPCSSALGDAGFLIATPPHLSTGAPAIDLLVATRNKADTPVVTLFVPQQGGGVLYILEGVYFSDVLRTATRMGAAGARLIIQGSGSLTDQGRFAPLPPDVVPERSSHIPRLSRISHASAQWPLDISVTPDPTVFLATYLRYLAVSAAACATLAAMGLVMLRTTFSSRQRLLKDVRAGLRKNQFHLVYQPITDLGTGRWVGVEALIRWRHPRYGTVSPGAYMNEVESSDLIGPLTLFVLRRALAELAQCDLPPRWRLTINVAPSHLATKGAVDELVAIVAAHAQTYDVVIEITERQLLRSSVPVHRALECIRNAGMLLAADDFGSESSNMDLLSRFKFDFLKIDRQFVEHVDRDGMPFVQAILSLARDLGVTVVAEGVETASQAATLQRIGVPLAQGYYYLRPVPIETLSDHLASGRPSQ